MAAGPCCVTTQKGPRATDRGVGIEGARHRYARRRYGFGLRLTKYDFVFAWANQFGATTSCPPGRIDKEVTVIIIEQVARLFEKCQRKPDGSVRWGETNRADSEKWAIVVSPAPWGMMTGIPPVKKRMGRTHLQRGVAHEHIPPA